MGLTREEIRVLDLLAEAWNVFTALPEFRPGDNTAFQDVIHQAEALVALRVARRANPEIWGRPQVPT